MLYPMTKKEAKEAEKTTTPILNLLNKREDKQVKKLSNNISKMFKWLEKFTTTKERKNHIKINFGNPLYHAQYEYREAIWGFKYKKINIIVYYSTKGFSIQVSPDCSCGDALKILKKISSQLEK